uniref:hypothetical protein n=1 Tax=Marinobacter sp. TaxID=50741 RepID=UPI00262DE9D3
GLISFAVAACSPGTPEPYTDFPKFNSVMSDLESRFGCRWSRYTHSDRTIFCVAESAAGNFNAHYEDAKIVVHMKPESELDISAQNVDDLLYQLQEYQVQEIRFYLEKVNLSEAMTYLQEGFGFDSESIDRLMATQTRSIISSPYKVRSLPDHNFQYRDTVFDILLEYEDK